VLAWFRPTAGLGHLLDRVASHGFGLADDLFQLSVNPVTGFLSHFVDFNKMVGS